MFNTKNKLNKIIKTINLNINEIYLIYVIFGLSIAIFLKDLNLTFFNIPFFETIYFYRGLLFILSIYIFFVNKKKFNIEIIFLSLISFIFLYNALFSEEMKFTLDKEVLLEQFNIKAHSFFFNEKINTLIINFFNIFFPLLVLIFLKFEINLNSFYKISYKVGEIFIVILTIFIFLNLILLYQQPGQENSYLGAQSDFPKHFINPHGLLFFLNIFFIQNIFEIYNKNNIKKNLFYIFLITFLFFLSGSILFFCICAVTLLIHIYFKNKKIYIYFSVILILILILIFYVFVNSTDGVIHGSLSNSINVRIAYLKLFLFETVNLNYLFGSNIFSENIYTYPHNALIDIFICSGLLGIIISFFLLFKIINFYKSKYRYPYNFLLLIFIQLLLFSLLSGFFFKNIALNIVLAIMLNLSNLKEEKII